MPESPAVALWSAIEARDWASVERLLSDDFTAEWPQSGEVFNRQTFLRVNEAYPGDWHARVVRVIDADRAVVTEVEVTIEGRVERAISIFEIRGEVIIHLREYWPESFPVPEWRRFLLQGLT